MTAIILIVLISVYSICLVHITLFAVIYIKHKDKIELYYLIVLSNIFLMAVISMVAFLSGRNSVSILVNSVFSLYITVPLYSFFLFDIDKKYYKNIPILVIIGIVIDNILIANNILGILYILKIVFYILLTIPIFIKNKNKCDRNSLKWKMQKANKITVVIFVPLAILLIPFSSLIFEISYLSSLFWAIFTLLYQIPGLVYCKAYLRNRDITLGKTEISSLTKRENEIAAAICSGLKYAEIAENLFITLSAVKNHTTAIYKKLGIKNNRELLRIFMESPKNDVPDEPVS